MQWTLAYAAAAYTLLHGVEMVSHYFEWPLLVGRLVTVTLALGVPIATILAWYHGHKAKHRISGPELTMITVLLVIAGSVLWVVARTNEAKPLVPAAATTAPTTPIATASGAPNPSAPRTSIAVMPFVNLTGDAKKDYLGDGMAEEVINTLTRVPGLRVQHALPPLHTRAAIRIFGRSPRISALVPSLKVACAKRASASASLRS